MSADSVCKSREAIKMVIIVGAIVFLGLSVLVLDSKVREMQETVDGFTITLESDEE